MKKKLIMKNVLVTAVIYAMTIFCLTIFFDKSFGNKPGDFINQHTMFFDYLRNNFWSTFDIFPQWNMNYGLGQSYVTLYYYGLYNPFIMLSFILPNINPIYYFEMIVALLMVINAAAMTVLLLQNKVKTKLITPIAVLSSFSGVFFYHNGIHPMFIYYIPLFTLSLVSLHYMVEKNQNWLYMLCVSLIFYTNFTFAPVISILQFVYFMSILPKRDYLKNLKSFFFSYSIGVLSGFLILLPTAEFMLQTSSRTSDKEIALSFFNNFSEVIRAISSLGYVSGIFIIGILALLIAIFGIKNKKYYIISISMLILLFIQPLNFALNIFEYINMKVYIMMTPLFWLMLGEGVSKITRKQLVIFTILATLIYSYANFNVFSYEIFYTILVAFMIVIMLMIKRNSIKYILMVTLALLSIQQHAFLIDNSDISEFVNINSDISENFEPYRSLYDKDNYIESISNFIPNIYSSLENSYYIEASRYEYESAISKSERKTRFDSFNNPYYMNIFGVKNEEFDVNPIVYGVSAESTYNISDYENLTATEKLYAANQAIFIDDVASKNFTNSFEIQDVYSADGEWTFDEDEKFEVAIPEKYQDGILTIKLTANLEGSKTQYQNVFVNDILNEVRYADTYGINDNSEVTFIVNTKDLEKLQIRFEEQVGNPFSYSNLEVTYQDFSDFESKKMQTTAPSSFEVDLNNSMSFTVDMGSQGYLATTIPYDPGYTIYVDGAETEITKVNGLYIGAELSEGNHEIKIVYNIPGFKIGLVITIISYAIIFISLISDIRKRIKIKKKTRAI